MLLLYLIGFVAGIVAGISPCILPVLPVVLVAGVTAPRTDTIPSTDGAPRTDTTPSPGASPPGSSHAGSAGQSRERGEPGPELPSAVAGATLADGAGSSGGGSSSGGAPLDPTLARVRTPARVVRPTAPPTAPPGARVTGPPGPRGRPDPIAGSGPTPARSYRAYAVVAGLVVSFTVFTLVGSSILSALDLPQDFIRDAGFVVLGLVSVGLIVPPLGHLLERPFARLGRHQPRGNSGGFVLGLGLGAVFIPCAGPVFGAITTVAGSHRVGLAATVLTVDFSLGAAVPLLIFALAGQRVAERVAAFRTRAPLVRVIGGVVLLTMTLLIAFNVTDGLQTALPGYTTVLQNHIEGSSYAHKELAELKSGKSTVPQTALSSCPTGQPILESCGRAPNFRGISAWLNTPGGRPLSISGLRGKVVLVDFWTYSCINCQRSLPHVEAWYARYHADGLEVVGVHTPEFAFEHVVSNVVQASAQLGVRYPVAVDDDYDTWNAYDNEYWPAEYLIDANGDVRHTEFGEGDYGVTESLIRQLLVEADPGVHLPPPTDVANLTPTEPLTPESYLGYSHELPNFDGGSITPDQPAHYQFPSSLPSDYLAFSGTWTIGSEAATAGTNARLELAFQADDVYLVLGGTGTVQVSVNGHPTKTVVVSGFPRLYTMVHASSYESATLVLTMSPGVQAYDFTFG